MESIQEISDEAKHLLGGAEIGRDQLVSRLEVSLALQYIGHELTTSI
jgi:hypothetical protein